jgi:hypothetical protein
VSSSGGTTGSGGDTFIQASGGSGLAPGTDGGCGSQSIPTSVEQVVVPGNVLIVFDQSDSMSAADFGPQQQVRWKAASDAVVAAITPNADALTIGAVFFPSVVIPASLNIFGACDVTAVAAIDDTTSSNPQIPFMPGKQFLTAWDQHWARNPLTLGTPTNAGMQRGDEALKAANLTGNTVVILVTDGEPTCGTPQTAIDLATAWKAANVPTYVIGIPGSFANKSTTLTGIAAAGGTTDYVLPSDGAALSQVFTSITSKIVKRTFNSCGINFSQTPPGNVFLVVTDAQSGQQFRVNQGPDGWTLDGAKATLSGATCNDALAGKFSNLQFDFGCRDIPLLR